MHVLSIAFDWDADVITEALIHGNAIVYGLELTHMRRG